MSPKQNATINPSKGGFAVYDANGAILRDGFKSRGHAAMWATRQNLYQGKYRRKRDRIPEPLLAQRWIGVPVIADLQGRPYEAVLPEVRAGVWGTPIKNGRSYHVRYGDYEQKVAEREIKIIAAEQRDRR